MKKISNLRYLVLSTKATNSMQSYKSVSNYLQNTQKNTNSNTNKNIDNLIMQKKKASNYGKSFLKNPEYGK